MPSNHLILCYHFLLLPSIFPRIKVFLNKLSLHIRWTKYWSVSISPTNEYSRLISFRIDWFDLLAIQGTVKSLLQHHSPKASILWSSAFFIGPSLKSFDYMDLCQQSDVCFLNRLSRFVTFMHWRRRWQPTPVFLPGESQGRGSLVGCRLWGRTESDTTEAT